MISHLCVDVCVHVFVRVFVCVYARVCAEWQIWKQGYTAKKYKTEAQIMFLSPSGLTQLVDYEIQTGNWSLKTARQSTADEQLVLIRVLSKNCFAKQV